MQKGTAGIMALVLLGLATMGLGYANRAQTPATPPPQATQAPESNVGAGGGTIGQLDQFTSTTSPTSAITQATYGKAFRLSGQAAGCGQFSANGTLTSTGIACGSGSGSTFAYPFPSDATSTKLSFNGGLSTTYASTTGLSGTFLCISADCRTSWPSGGGGGSGSVSTSSTETSGYLPKFTSTAGTPATIANSLVYDNGTNVGIGTTTGASILNVAGSGAGTLTVYGNSSTVLSSIGIIDNGTSGNSFTGLVNPSGAANSNATTQPLTAIFFSGAGSTNGLRFISRASNAPIDFFTGGVTAGNKALTILGTNQYVGIGTSTPGTRLGVNGDAVIAGQVTGQVFTATSSTAASVLPYASTTALSATSLCFSTDCRTAWPSAGSSFSYPFPSNATSTQLAFNGGLTAAGATSTALAVTGSTTISSVLNVGGVINANGGIVGALTGNASTATALATGRTISISGDLTYTSPSFDGSGNVTAAGTLATVNSNVGTFGSASVVPTITVNGKGLTTAVTTNTVVAPAGTLSGATLNSGVTASSLTSVGTLTALTVSGQTSMQGASSTVFSSSYASSTDLRAGKFSGAGLVDCVNAATSKVLYTLATGLFSCGTDQTGTGAPYPFQGAGNSTSTLVSFTGGLTASNATTTNTFSGRDTANTAAFGATATSSFSSTGALTLASALAITSGGTAATSQTSNGVNFYNGSSITSGTGLTWDGTTLGVSGSGLNNTLSVTSTNSTSGGLYFRNNQAGAQAVMYVDNDRGSFASYGGFLQGGSTNAIGNLFGVSRADRTFVFADGASSNGLVVGTLTSDPLIFGTNNTNRMSIDANGVLTIATTTAGTLKTNASGVVYADTAGAASTASSTVQTFTASGTWTKPANVRYVKIEVQSAGAQQNSAAGGQQAGGGGSGAYCEKTLPASVLGSTETITVGTAALGSGSTSFGTWIAVTNAVNPANGSGGGTGATAPTGATTCDVKVDGQNGTSGSGGGTTVAWGGKGGDSFLGHGGGYAMNGSGASAVVGLNASGWGGGAGGGTPATDANPTNPGPGTAGAGVVIVYEYY